MRDQLRDGVEIALRELGTALLDHPDSGALRESIETGRLSADGYYRELLRIIYRLLFLMVTEERRLLFSPDARNADLQGIYSRFYSVNALRDRAQGHFAKDLDSDLWIGLAETFRLFRDDHRAQQIGLYALNGELFGQRACEHIEPAACENKRLLTAIFHLSSFREGDSRRRVNYAAIDVEELGSIYESLLEYRPEISLSPPSFDLVAGSERRHTGSYYTPPELVRELIDHALVPVMEERLAKADGEVEQEEALLNLNVCDPAAGSGHFVLAAARRIARELARVRTGEDEPNPSDYREAVRDVIRQCIYAVDKNPLAVDLCKVALWIESHSSRLPLSFMDHHIKCGDSLVGVGDLRVLREGIPDDAYKRSNPVERKRAAHYQKRNKNERDGHLRGQMGLAAGVPATVDTLADDFNLLAEYAEGSPDDVAEKERYYQSLRGQDTDWWTAKVACDLWTSTFFMPLDEDVRSAESAIPTTGIVRDYLAHPRTGDGQLVGRAGSLSGEHRFFHWPLEFPEVFQEGGFDVLVGNPPFVGGKRISGALGDDYRAYLLGLYPPARGTADLCAFFYRRAFDLMGDGGFAGMVAVNTIGEGDTREGGLAPILAHGGRIAFAQHFVKWPGQANVEVNLIALGHGDTRGLALLDGSPVEQISSRLDDMPEIEPFRLLSSKNKAFIGSLVRGIGFVLAADKAKILIAQDSRNSDCLFPYLNGSDLNSTVEQKPKRWVINFFDWERDRAEQYPDLFEIVRAEVLPEREKIRHAASRRKNVAFFWRYDAIGKKLYETIQDSEQILVRSRVSELHMLAFVPNGWVYNEQTVIFAFDDHYHFALLQSHVHEVWVRKNASTLRTDIRYTPTDCFLTFAFPQNPGAEDHEQAERIGEDYHEHRRQTMLDRQLGLTKTYNLFHDPGCMDGDIARTRELHAEMDRAILACYGWDDLDPGHDFYPNERGKTRYTVSPDARREILRRLLELNLEIAAEEQGT